MPLNYHLTRGGSPSTRGTFLPLTFLIVTALAAPPLSAGADKKADMVPRDAKKPGVAQGEYLTTNQGVRLADDDNSLKGGTRRPTRALLVNGNLGTADTARDARGFATKFYTSEGIWEA